MKNDEIKRTMKQFERVWPRVAGKDRPEQGPPPPPGPPQPPPPERETEALAELIRGETAAARRYEGAAARTGGANANTLRRLAAGSWGLVKQLQAEYFLRTGDSLSVPRGPQEKRPLGETLRLAWAAAGAMEKAYLAAASRTDDAGLHRLYGDAAKMKQGQRQTLRELTKRMMR